MEIEQTMQAMLQLGAEWEVASCRYEPGAETFYIVIRETPALWQKERCGKDDGKVYCYDHVGLTRWKHLNIFNQACELQCDLPRAKCRSCGSVYRITPPWEGLSKHFTRDFEAFALTLMREMPVSRVSDIVGVNDGRLWRMLLAHVEAAYAELPMNEVTVIGADEMNRRKGHHYLTVFCDLTARRLLYATPGRDASVWERFARAFREHGGNSGTVSQISIDMSPAYRQGAADCFGRAEVVFDKFHVIGHAGIAVDTVRRLEAGLDKRRQSLLKETRWLWLKNPNNLTDNQQRRLNRIDQHSLWTAKAYQMRLALQAIYQLPRLRARQRLLAWCRWVSRAAAKAPSQLLLPMLRVARMVESHLSGILAHWSSSVTNAFLEGLNSLFSATKRKARGYRSTRYFIAMLYFTAAKLNIPAQPNFPLANHPVPL
ncbi:MAG: ISL3 family transposase [Verrucomicrobiales bacterium]|jgi:transposase|nr:ISL3 family transposase [Verrucomicrobiales bacterium]